MEDRTMSLVAASGEPAKAVEGTGLTVAVILPAFDEELTVGPTIVAFHKALPQATIVVVDNNSQDGTVEVATRELRDLPCPTFVLGEPMQGKGLALRRAFFEVDADIFLLVDADMTYPAEAAHTLIKPILDGRADMVVGDRRSDGHYERESSRRFHSLGNRIVQSLVNRLFHTRLNDIMSGYRALSSTFVGSYPILVSGFQVETDMTLHALEKRFRILEVPVAYRDRPPGSHSKLATFGDGARVVWTVFRVLRYYRPLQFFSIVGLALAMLGLAAGTPPVLEYFAFQYIEHVPLAILASGLGVLAALAFAVGLVLDSVVHHEKMRYELELMRDRRQRARSNPPHRES